MIGTSGAFGVLLESPVKLHFRDCSPVVRELLTSQVKLILPPKQRAKPKTSTRKTGSSMPHCVEVQKFYLFLGEKLQLLLKCGSFSCTARKYTGR